MPFSIKHNLLFIHIPKCAGRSINITIGTTSQKEQESYKWRSFLNRAAKFILYISRDKKSMPRLWGIHDMSFNLSHLTYQEIQLLNLMSTKKLEDIVKFTVVRNPYDRVVSSYKYLKQTGRINSKTLKEFIEDYYVSDDLNHNDRAHKRMQLDYLKDVNGNIVINEILRFENLAEDFNAFIRKYKIDTTPLSHFGKSNRKNYRNYYDAETQIIVSDFFREDINYFGYTF